MRNGTQEELDAAKDDATLLPFDALFMAIKAENNSTEIEIGREYFRSSGMIDDRNSVRFASFNSESIIYADALDFEVIK